jgi:predicted amidohydrolase
MRCGAEPEKNLARAIEFIRDAARQGAEIVCLPELFRSQYFCQTEDHKNFDLAEEVPGKSTAALGEVARRNRHSNHCIAFRETQRRAFITTPRQSSTQMENCSGNIAKCIFPMIRCITKSFISRRAISDFGRGTLRVARSASVFAGTNGIRKRRD